MPPGLDSGLLGLPGMDSDVGLDSGVLALSVLDSSSWGLRVLASAGLDSNFLGETPGMTYSVLKEGGRDPLAFLNNQRVHAIGGSMWAPGSPFPPKGPPQGGPLGWRAARARPKADTIGQTPGVPWSSLTGSVRAKHPPNFESFSNNFLGYW